MTTSDAPNDFWTTKIKPDSTIYLKGEYAVSDDVLSKLVGAMKLAEFAENEHEAANGARKVSEIIQKYNIDMGDITFADNERPQVVEKFWYSANKNKDLALVSLANVLARHNFVYIYTTHQNIYTNTFHSESISAIAFVGREKNVDAVMSLFETIRIRLNKLASIAFQEYVNEQDKHGLKHVHGTAWKKSWFLGAVDGINSVLDIQQAEFEKLQSANGNTGKALIVSLAAENKEYINNRKDLHLRPNKSPSIKNYGAYQNGRETGKAIGIRPTIESK